MNLIDSTNEFIHFHGRNWLAQPIFFSVIGWKKIFPVVCWSLFTTLMFQWTWWCVACFFVWNSADASWKCADLEPTQLKNETILRPTLLKSWRDYSRKLPKTNNSRINRIIVKFALNLLKWGRVWYFFYFFSQ